MTELTELLGLRRITGVYCIDDDNVPPKIDNLDEAVDAILGCPPRKLRIHAAKDPRFEALNTLREGIRDLPRDEQRPQIKGALEELAEQVNLRGEDLEELRQTLFHNYHGDTAKRLKTAFGGDILRALSFAAWRAQSADIIGATTSEGRLLLLVDELNTREPEVDLNGVKLLADLWRNYRPALENIDVIVVTSNCTSAGEFEQARSLLERVREELGDPELASTVRRAFVLSKERLSQNPLEDHFAVHLKRIKASELRGQLVGLATKLMHEAITDSIAWLEEIPLSEFQGSVFASSENEGAAEIDTLLRLAGIRQRAGLERKLGIDGSLRKKIAEMRAYTLKSIDAEQMLASQSELRKLRVLEFERSGEHVNSLAAALVCGDVFELIPSNGTPMNAIVLANACDLILRADGTRKLARAWLVPIMKDTRAVLEQHEQRRGVRAPLSYLLTSGGKPDDRAYLFDNSAVESIDLAVLDLCWTNLEGRALFDPPAAADVAGFLLPPQMKRLECLAQRLTQQRFGGLEIWGRVYSPLVEEVPAQRVGPGTVSQRVSYTIRRTWRLAPEFSTAALAALAQCLARPAFDHDYLRVE